MQCGPAFNMTNPDPHRNSSSVFPLNKKKQKNDVDSSCCHKYRVSKINNQNVSVDKFYCVFFCLVTETSPIMLRSQTLTMSGAHNKM